MLHRCRDEESVSAVGEQLLLEGAVQMKLMRTGIGGQLALMALGWAEMVLSKSGYVVVAELYRQSFVG